MAYTATTNLSLPIITTGTESGTWGDVVDNGLTAYLDIAIAGGLAIAITTADVTLTKTAGTNAATGIVSTTAQYAILNISGAKTAARNLNLPITSKSYIINNAGTGGFLLTVRGVTPTTGVTMVDGENAVVAWNGTDFVKVSSNLAGVPSINGGQLAGLRNRIINGGMAVDQRNVGAALTTTGGASPLAFSCDRWQVRSTNANASVQQVNTNNIYRMVFTGAASITAVAAQQSIEAVNCADMAGKTVTLSVAAKSTSLTTLTLEAYYANTTNTFGTWASPTVTSIGTQAVTISATESVVSWTFAVPAAATTGLQIRITGGALLAAQTLTIGNVQLEIGSVATTFEQRPIGLELALCQRYYNKTFSDGTAPAQSGPASGAILVYMVAATGYYGVFYRFPITMRAIPTTVSTYSVVGGTSGYWRNGGNDTSSQPSVAGQSTSGIYISLNNSVSNTWLADVYYIHVTAEAEL